MFTKLSGVLKATAIGVPATFVGLAIGVTCVLDPDPEVGFGGDPNL